MTRPDVLRPNWSAALRTQANHDIDVGDFHAVGRLRKVFDAHRTGVDVEHPVLAFDEEVVMVRRVGVEIGLDALDGEDAQEAGLGELMQRVVDRRQRDRNAGDQRLLVQLLRRKMTIAVGEEQGRGSDAAASAKPCVPHTR